MTPHQRELQRIAVSLLSIPETERRAALSGVSAEDRTYVTQLSADVSRACRTLAAISGWSYQRAVAAMADMQARSDRITVFLERHRQPRDGCPPEHIRAVEVQFQ